MSFAAIAYTIPQYEDFANYWMKAYEQGTTTPKVMATDSTGGTTVAKFELSAVGFPVTAGNALVIPFIDGPYDLWLFPTEAEADANNTANAIQLADNIDASIEPEGNISESNLADYTGIEFLSVTDMANGVLPDGSTIFVLSAGETVRTAEFSTNDAGGGTYDVVLTSSVTPNGIDIIVGVLDALISFVLRKDGYIIPEQYGITRGAFTKPSNIDGLGVAESSSVGASFNFSRLDGFGFISSNTTNNAGWVADASEAETIDVEMPFAVIIGDSIAEGHPDLHGRLDTDGAGNVDLTWPNSEGQPSFELSRKTNIHWFNQGVGGENSTQVLNRFPRDALGETFDPGDGKGTSTLSRAPFIIWVNVGINDVSELEDTAVTKRNLLTMLALALENGIPIGFNTIGPVDFHTGTQRAMQDDINEFILNELARYGALTFDFHTWFVDPADATQVNPRLDADGVHPSKAGYTSYSARLVSQYPQLVASSIIVESKFDQDNIPSSAKNLLGVTVDDIFNNPDNLIPMEEFEQLFDRQARINHVFDMTNRTNLRITASEIDGGVDLSKVAGISKVSIEMGARGRLSGTLQATFTKTSGTWALSTLFARNGITLGAVGNDIGLIFDRNVKSVSVFHVGSAAPTNYKATGLTPSAAATVKLWNEIDNSALVATGVSNSSTFQVIARY